MQRSLRILFTNNTLGKPAGTELSVHDYGLALMERGHQSAAFSSQLGEIAERLRRRGVPVVEDLDSLPWEPDIIHGHHEWETSLAALRWPATPVLSFCRGIGPWQEAPCRAPWVHRYVAVDEPCRQRLVEREGIPREKVVVIPNGVDLRRFACRGPLPSQPQRVLVFSNYANETNYLRVIRDACRQLGVECGAIGAGVGNVCARPEEVLPGYDLVFAKGKAALEALAAGCAVAVGDAEGLGELVTTENFQSMRRQSFGYPCMTEAWEIDAVKDRMRRCDPAIAGEVTALAREECGISHTIDALERLYTEAMEAPGAAPEAGVVGAFAARFLTSKSLPYKLGREIQIAWRRDREVEAPGGEVGRAKEFDRMLNSFRKGLVAVRERDKSRTAVSRGADRGSGRGRTWKRLLFRKPGRDAS